MCDVAVRSVTIVLPDGDRLRQGVAGRCVRVLLVLAVVMAAVACVAGACARLWLCVHACTGRVSGVESRAVSGALLGPVCGSPGSDRVR